MEFRPEAFAVNGDVNGHHSGGHDGLFGPTIELVPASGHNNSDGHHDDETPELPASGGSLFSWAEFVAQEPERPKRGNGKPRPASLSMFEWAMEQEREKETVGAGR